MITLSLWNNIGGMSCHWHDHDYEDNDANHYHYHYFLSFFESQGKGTKAHCDGSSSGAVTGARLIVKTRLSVKSSVLIIRTDCHNKTICEKLCFDNLD